MATLVEPVKQVDGEEEAEPVGKHAKTGQTSVQSNRSTNGGSIEWTQSNGSQSNAAKKASEAKGQEAPDPGSQAGGEAERTRPHHETCGGISRRTESRGVSRGFEERAYARTSRRTPAATTPTLCSLPLRGRDEVQRCAIRRLQRGGPGSLTRVNGVGVILD